MGFESLVHHLNPGPTYISSATPSFVHPFLRLPNLAYDHQMQELVDLAASVRELGMRLECSIKFIED